MDNHSHHHHQHSDSSSSSKSTISSDTSDTTTTTTTPSTSSQNNSPILDNTLQQQHQQQEEELEEEVELQGSHQHQQQQQQEILDNNNSNNNNNINIYSNNTPDIIDSGNNNNNNQGVGVGESNNHLNDLNNNNINSSNNINIIDIDSNDNTNNNTNNNNNNNNNIVSTGALPKSDSEELNKGWILDGVSSEGQTSPTLSMDDTVHLPSATQQVGMSNPPTLDNNNNNNNNNNGGNSLNSSHGNSLNSMNSSMGNDSTIREFSPMTPSSRGNRSPTTPSKKSKSGSTLRSSKPKKKAKPLKKQKKKKYQGQSRTLYVNNPALNITQKFADNRIKTTKYTVISFIPKNLYEQFRRAANFYFLVIAIIQLIPGLSPVNPYTTWLPLLFVLAVTAVKEGIEDWKRRQSDNTINNLPCQILKGQQFATIPWKELKVGDIVKVEKGQRFPADLVLLNTSEQHGVCYIETSNLDGETNLKQRQALPQTFERFRNEEDLSFYKGVIECEHPNNIIYIFNGNITLTADPNDTKYPLNSTQTLLRGCVLRNTDWVYGVVVYTGEDTKIMQNSTDAPSKRSTLEKLVNRGLINLFAVMFVVCLVSTVVNVVWTSQNKDKTWYLGFKSDSTGKAALNFFTFMIAFAVMIPISLYVSLELVKVAQAIYIYLDLDMYHEETDTPARSRTSNLSEELGQIEYIFSDKTGTLTRNQMDFLKCSVGYVCYGHLPSGGSSGNSVKDGDMSLHNTDSIGRASGIGKAQRSMSVPSIEGIPGAEPSFGFKDRRIIDHLDEVGSQQSEMIHQFLTLLAVCHSVIPDRPNKDDSVIEYEASSPDEAALVSAARNLGYAFYNREPTAVLVNVRGKIERYEFLNILEFNSDRKRMSIIVRDPKNRIIIYTKGADTTILPLLRKDQNDVQLKTLEYLQDFAADGLRTLICAYAVIGEEEYHKWNELYKEAAISIVDRDKKVDQVAELIERDLELIGSTAIEDKLQIGVPQAIANLAKANIKLWVLTGDKQETAINIGFSCHLLTSDMKIIILNGKTEEDVSNQIKAAMEAYFSDNPLEFPNNGFALVIEGACLNYALEGNLKDQFLSLASNCKAVICCRTTPLQKAQVVKVVRDTLRAVTLAIGDGANDVSMIQAAHIGIGISGNEGMQAVMASDYSIAQFRFLYKLIVVHGRWDYKRNARLILYCFYKNMVFAMTQFWFGVFNAFSAQTIYDSLSIAVFNVIFTGLPIIIYAIFDQDVSAASSMAYPQLYKSGQKDSEFNLKILWLWLAEGWAHSIVIFFCVYGIFDYGSNLVGNGQTLDIWGMGQLLFILVVVTVNLKLALETRYWTWLTHFSIWGSIIIWFLWQAILGSIQSAGSSSSGEVWQIAYRNWQAPYFWLALVCIPVICLIPDSLYKLFQRDLKPYPFQIVQEMERVNGKPDKMIFVEKGMSPSGLIEQFQVADAKKSMNNSTPASKKRLPFLTWMKSSKVNKKNTGFSFSHPNENLGSDGNPHSL